MSLVTDPAGVEHADGTRRERVGWYFYDWANSAFSTTVVTVFLGPYLGAVADRAADAHGRVYPLGVPVAAGSLFAYTVSLSVLLQVVVLPVVGAIADRSARKRHLLALFAYLGSAATVGLVFLTGNRYLLGAVLLLIANIAFGASVVVYNSFLPQIAAPDERDRVSSVGWAVGYIGGALLLTVNLAAVLGKDTLGMSKADVARWSIVSAGLWWAAFTTLPLRRLRDRPAVAGTARGSVLTDGFRQLAGTLRHLKAYPLTLAFLGAYLMYSDGIQTVITLASVYATKELGLPDTVLVPTILMVQFLAFAGALLLGWIAKRVGGWKAVLASLAFWAVVLVIAYVLPHGKALPFVGLAALIGLVLGGSQALSRSLFSQLIPTGREAEYFGIYEISDKGTSWLGPLLFGVAYQSTGSYRASIISLVVFFVIGFVALAAIPMRRAITQAGNVPPRLL
ncbi:MAG TPA: MFS transporter [Micromonosporaceae bacterium]